MTERSLIHISANLRKDLYSYDKYIIEAICTSKQCKKADKKFEYLINHRLCGSFKHNYCSYINSFCYIGYMRFEKNYENFDYFLLFLSEKCIYYPKESNFLGFIRNDYIEFPEYLILNKEGYIDRIDYKKLRKKPCKKKLPLTSVSL